ncbi:hypothetical protein QF031_002921 [Pseudarthrobacter defluvii]|uniref:hypothetical protein n=1 Tax=Pseudarthrobacter defluvii TaxID=410837 RepID=UPI0027843B76|nr:hypothetical protein [Pseudarthrobacter defluvii]MDQ0770172.1 hypothetical protein [Pseudarthrobacter defluvii]
MSADILTLRPAPISQAEAARRRAMLLHPSNFTPAPSPALETGETAKVVEKLANRFSCLHEKLMECGLAAGEARTEVAQTVAREIWDGFASQLRAYRAAGQQMDANVLAVALASIQCMTRALPRHPGDLGFASRTVSAARRRLQYNGGLLHRLHPHRNPAFHDAVTTLEALEAFLTCPQQKAA